MKSYQFFPVIVCLVLFIIFIVLTNFFIGTLINPFSAQKVQLKLELIDIAVGFFLYFVTAVDYALIVGRMQIANPGLKQRFSMNVFTCLGCFVGVSLVLFLWGFAKEIVILIIPLLFFAGSVMVKLAYEGHKYFAYAPEIPQVFRKGTMFFLKIYYLTRFFTFWMPELGTPTVKKMTLLKLSLWSFFLPFIIGIDDLVGYMGAMTIYNAYGLLFGIYLADIVIDILIFMSPSFTKKLVENSKLSLLAAYAFLYLAYKSFSESYHLLVEKVKVEPVFILLWSLIFITGVILVDLLRYRVAGKPLEHIRGKIKA